MQTYIRCQDFTSTNIGSKRKMPQACLPPLNVALSAPAHTPLTPVTPGTGIMPSITRETLAMRLRQNWLAKHPVDTPLPTAPSTTDDSLTSLNWLQNLNIMKMASPTPPASPQPAEVATIMQYTPSTQVNPNAILNMGSMGCSPPPPTIRIKQEPGSSSSTPTTVAPPRVNHFMDIIPPASSPGMDKIDYRTNPCVKPPYSYATLICMAMKETKKNKITLAGIYTWITENFMYYKVADPSWQNSIRHNLSLNKCFQKVPRRKDEPGKGGFWRINPEYEDMFINGIFKKRRGSTGTRDVPLTVATPLKRLRRDDDDSDSSLSNGPISASPAKIARFSIKREPEDVHTSDVLDENIDFNWNSILSQDITVGGMKVKTEEIIDGDSDIASPITALSPPPSEGSNSDDIILDDLFKETDFTSEPLDFTTGGPLDLSVNGLTMKPPQWWEESLNLGSSVPRGEGQESGLHTPIAQSPAADAEYAHPWAEDKAELDNAMACFDTDIANFFDVESMSSQSS